MDLSVQEQEIGVEDAIKSMHGLSISEASFKTPTSQVKKVEWNINLLEEIDEALLIDPNDLETGVQIGDGTYSVVKSGLYKKSLVAIKEMDSKNFDATVFKREITILSSINHQNIIKFVGAEEGPTPKIITELMRGGSLEDYLKSLKPHCLPLKTALSFGFQISKAVEYLHGQNIIHRDIKPGNVLLSADKKTAKLADFGLARKANEKKMTPVIGSYRYMAPEMMDSSELKSTGFSKMNMREEWKKSKKKKNKNKPQCYSTDTNESIDLTADTADTYNHKVDTYSFALVLWQMITNTLPYEEKELCEDAATLAYEGRRPSLQDIPDDVGDLIRYMWDRDPVNRPDFIKVSNSLASLIENLDKHYKNKKKKKKGKH